MRAPDLDYLGIQRNDLDFCSIFVLIAGMGDRPASWRMPTPKQMEKLAIEAERKAVETDAREATGGLSDAHWDAVLKDPRAGYGSIPIQQRRLSEIPRHVLRVSCRRCDRVVEIQTADAIRLYGAHAVWKDVGGRILDNTCRQRTGSRDDDGCWPNFESH
jgi:hypothetical protein